MEGYQNKTIGYLITQEANVLCRPLKKWKVMLEAFFDSQGVIHHDLI
jgi:hypothetical protein